MVQPDNSCSEKGRTALFSNALCSKRDHIGKYFKLKRIYSFYVSVLPIAFQHLCYTHYLYYMYMIENSQVYSLISQQSEEGLLISAQLSFFFSAICHRNLQKHRLDFDLIHNKLGMFLSSIRGQFLGFIFLNSLAWSKDELLHRTLC